MIKKYKEYIISSLISLGVGALSALVTKNSMDIYSSITLPPLSPPSWVFPVVWSVLFLFMGVSSGGIYKKEKKITLPLWLYVLNLLVNFSWSVVFFNLRAFGFSLLVLVLLVGIIAAMISEFHKIEKWCAYLLLPYLFWCVFALYLNFAIYVLN